MSPEHIIARQQRAIDDLRFTMRQVAEKLGEIDGYTTRSGQPIVEACQSELRGKAAYYQPGGAWSQKGAEHVEA